MKALSNREIDLAIVYAQNHSHEFESMLLARENFTLALSLQHPLARMRVARLERFLGGTLFLPSQGESAGLREAILSTFVQHGGVPSRTWKASRIGLSGDQPFP
jgi:DNA-binding transcriptional LysR family regulator